MPGAIFDSMSFNRLTTLQTYLSFAHITYIQTKILTTELQTHKS